MRPKAYVKLPINITINSLDGTYTQEQGKPELINIVDQHGNELRCALCGGNFKLNMERRTYTKHMPSPRSKKAYCSAQCLRIASF
jgi:hypothetical protein